MSVEFSVADYPIILQPWGLLGVMRKLDVRPALVTWLDRNVHGWSVEYRHAGPLTPKPVIVIDDDQEADVFRHAWLTQ